MVLHFKSSLFERISPEICSTAYNAQPVSISQIKPNLTQFSSDKFFGMQTMVRGHVNSSSLTLMIIMGNITQHNQQRDAHPITPGLEYKYQQFKFTTWEQVVCHSDPLNWQSEFLALSHQRLMSVLGR